MKVVLSLALVCRVVTRVRKSGVFLLLSILHRRFAFVLFLRVFLGFILADPLFALHSRRHSFCITQGVALLNTEEGRVNG